jgi:hypothetical protein
MGDLSMLRAQVAREGQRCGEEVPGMDEAYQLLAAVLKSGSTRQ